ncbi:Ubiquitin-conjugating enzyme E2 [Penicillium concentricum]|uniref:Ubiquitin-conjugating enzyme E2 n=1 Tax=Penicillium concentricum TaxID=293559 RepID=A0A9W9SQP1_9EURO|nr:Ubiquitin-conjugating enzyme E2 [Penicillium concentricum]KAJ5382820.1 Ubiquitin-conjugating enzyme E2 [Penicillium concentricum]
MPSNLRRLAADHAALHRDLPPYYLQPSDGDDLSQLTILLTGPAGTPFSRGLWELHLKMPDDYPKSPPKATFKTRIWHPNMEELTGAVCVDTLKRDWQPNLTLRDVLVTISCLLIYPNPDSALNASAGALMQENYAAFAHQAKLMTSIHAPIPPNLKGAVTEAKLRGEEAGTAVEQKEDDAIIQRPRKQARTHTATIKKTTRNTTAFEQPSQSYPSESSSNPFAQPSPAMTDDVMSDSENDDPASASKENNPTLSPSPVYLAPPSPRKTALGKRPLSVLSLPYPEDDADMMLIDSDNDNDTPAMTSNERNITANTRSRTSSPLRKTPKLSLLCGGVNASGRLRDEMPIFEDLPQLPMQDPLRRLSGDGKENRGSATARGLKEKREYHPMKTLNGSAPPSPAHAQLPTPSLSSSSLSASPNSGISKKKNMSGHHKRLAVRAKPRIGIRRL